MRISGIDTINTALSTQNAFYDGSGKLSRPARAQVAADYATATAAAAVVTYAAVAALKHIISGVVASYAGTTPAGSLKVEDVSGTVVFNVDLDGKGPFVITFPESIKAAAVNTALIVTLASGGTSVVGKVTVFGHRLEA